MANIWHGADPAEVLDAADYELGTILVALGDVTLDALRVWSPASNIARPNRKGHVWDMAGTLLATVDMPETMPTGWSTHPLAAPLALIDGDYRVVTYETNGNYGRVTQAFQSANHVAADQQAMFPQSMVVPTGNGRFVPNPGTFPGQQFQATFYGVDVLYTPATPEQPPPEPIDGGWTTDLLGGLAEHLAAAGVGTWRPTGTYEADEIAITLKTIPQDPEQIICLTPYTVTDDAALSDVIQGVQVRVRAGRDPRDSDNIADAVYDLLHGATGLTLGEAQVVQAYRQSSTPLGPDALGRHERSDNYYLQAARPTPHRTD